jgi:predicted lipoprotein with Yx(FWY)xxD motif
MKLRSSRSGQRWTILAVGAMASVFALAGCGDGDDAAAESGGDTGSVAVKNVDGVGMALVDATGKTLYFADQEAGGSIHCTAACLGFWFPAAATGAAGGAVADLSTVHRPDNGQDQLTFQGKPLYTFKLDTGPGQHAGHNLVDTFGDTKFTWHAATTAAAEPGTTDPAPTDPGAYDY